MSIAGLVLCESLLLLCVSMESVTFIQRSTLSPSVSEASALTRSACAWGICLSLGYKLCDHVIQLWELSALLPSFERVDSEHSEE